MQVRVVDLMYGRPVPDIAVRLSRPSTAQILVTTSTDEHGTCRFVPDRADGPSCQLDLDVDRYFVGIGVAPAYPRVTVTCTSVLTVTVLLAPFGHAVYLDREPARDIHERWEEPTDDHLD